MLATAVAGAAESPLAESHALSSAAQGPPATESAARRRVLVIRILGDDKFYFQPHSFLFAADGTFGVGKLEWTKYGGAVATATGRGFARSCVPNCSAGRLYHPAAQVRLSKITACRGHAVYARLHYSLTGPLPKGFPREDDFSMLPIGENFKPAC